MPLRVTVEHRQGAFTLAASFDAPATGITVLSGPSGAGKSTILSAMTGLLRPRRMDIDFSGERLDRVAPSRRRFASVFQDSRLFPHMTVRDNLLYGLRRAPKAPKHELAGHVYFDDTVAMLGLNKLLARKPATLSGGERQRVAIGRALRSQPRQLLMDEPLASLDAGLKRGIMPYLSRLHESLNLPVIYVTHAMDELVRLADHLVLLEAGSVVAQGTLPDLAARIDLPLARQRDAGGVLKGTLLSHDDGRNLSDVACGGMVFRVPRLDMPEQTPVRLRVPAREIVVARDAGRALSMDNVMPCFVAGIAVDEPGHAALVELDIGGGQLLARITLDAAERLSLRNGMRVVAMIQAFSVQTIG
jgi:molybdate transport system ATP-binding protein